VYCTSCGGPVFILGYSPLIETAAGPSAATVPRRYWLGPLLAALLTLTAAVLVFIRLIPALTSTEPAPTAAPRDDLRVLIAEGREALRHDDFRLAADRLTEARRQSGRQPDLLSSAERLDLTRLQPQVALIADLLSESLEEILQRADGSRAEEREAQFNLRYRGRAVIFDDVVIRDAAGRYDLAVYEIRTSGKPARVELNDLKLLGGLPLTEPRRMLFGARLAGLAREERGGRGVWVIHLDPDSGVLLTDEEVAGACCPRPLDADLRAVLRRQTEWMARH
jgi:hypothetical protein